RQGSKPPTKEKMIVRNIILLFSLIQFFSSTGQKLYSLSEITEDNFLKVERLVLANMELNQIPDIVYKMKSLRELDLSGNELTEFILNGALLKLERLNLSGALKGGNVFIDGNLLPEIKGINLSNCGLYDYSFKCIKGLFDLQYLNLN